MKISDQIRKAVRRLVEAEVAASWAGAQPPEDHTAIGAELMLARYNLEQLLKKIRSKGEPKVSG